MTAHWKLAAEAQLMSPLMPAVLTTGTLQSIAHMATTDNEGTPSLSTLHRWQQDLATSGKIQEVIKGIYLNRIGHSEVSPAAAAEMIRSRSVVSLSWVLEQAGITNNAGDTITCIIPTDPTWTNPQIGDRKTKVGTYRFFAMPAHVSEKCRHDDIQDPKFDYPRATVEKALLDWIYLGDSQKSRLTPPPLDLDLSRMDSKRLLRLSKQMGIQNAYGHWIDLHESFSQDDDVRENTGVRWHF